jgi:hypothetical protein
MKVLVAIAACALGLAAVRPTAADTVLRSTDDLVQVADLESSGAEVTGRLVNRSDRRLEDVHLLVSDMFLWRNEFHPGPDDPSQAVDIVVRGPIPPHGSVTFHVDRPPLPVRRDGTFSTDVTVVSLTAYDDVGRASDVDRTRATPLE